MSFFITLLAAIILYINTITTIKKIKEDESTIANTILGCICICFIIVAIFDHFG